MLRQTANGDSRSLRVDIAIYQDDGRFAAAIEGLSLKLLPPEALRSHAARQRSAGKHQRSRPGSIGAGLGADAAAIRSQLKDASAGNAANCSLGLSASRR